MMLVATDGEWTRRRVPDPKTAWEIARDLGIPVYDVQLTGYPQRVRDWNSRQRLAAQAQARLSLAFGARPSSSASSVRTPTPVPPTGV